MSFDKFALAPIISQKKRNRQRRETPRPDREYVYFIENRANGQVKIGRSNSVKNRIKSIERSKGADDGEYAILGFVTVSAGLSTKLEAAMHKEFADQRIAGEWFDLSGSNLMDAAIRAASAITGTKFQITGLAFDAPYEVTYQDEANQGCASKRRKGIPPGVRSY